MKETNSKTTRGFIGWFRLETPPRMVGNKFNAMMPSTAKTLELATQAAYDNIYFTIRNFVLKKFISLNLNAGNKDDNNSTEEFPLRFNAWETDNKHEPVFIDPLLYFKNGCEINSVWKNAKYQVGWNFSNELVAKIGISQVYDEIVDDQLKVYVWVCLEQESVVPKIDGLKCFYFER